VFEPLPQGEQDAFFEEAFSDTGDSAHEPNRSFVGPVISRKRYRTGFGLIIALIPIFVGRTGTLQIARGAEFRALAENNRIRHHILPAERGLIYDRNGTVLAKNEPTFQIFATPSRLPAEGQELDALYQHVEEVLNIPQGTLLQPTKEDRRVDELLLIDGLNYEEGMRFAGRRDEFPGFDIEVGSQRTYITYAIPTLSHLLGYTGILNKDQYQEKKAFGYRPFDHIGKQGLESQYETELRGTFGEEVLEVDALGNTERIISKVDPINGKNITLTIDAQLQAYIEGVLERELKKTDATKASVIATNPKTGEILAMVSWPAYDANLFTKGISQEMYSALVNNEDQPLFPRAYAGEFPSGSTIKPTFAAAALMEGIIDDKTTFLSTGGVRIGLWFFPDWRAGGHGVTNVYHAIADSVNTFFYMIGGGNETFNGLGIQKLMEYADHFGFGKKTGVDLPGEADGFLPSEDWKWDTKGEVWYIGDTYHVAIGQGDFLTTPLQIAQATALFANDGVLVTPHLTRAFQPTEERLTDTETAGIIKRAMRETITKGSGTSLQSIPVPTAGKTGTAQWSSTKANHAWFTGFAPYNDPQITLTVLVEEGADDVHHLAIPVAKDILTWWFSR